MASNIGLTQKQRQDESDIVSISINSSIQRVDKIVKHTPLFAEGVQSLWHNQQQFTNLDGTYNR